MAKTNKHNSAPGLPYARTQTGAEPQKVKVQCGGCGGSGKEKRNTGRDLMNLTYRCKACAGVGYTFN